MVKTFHGKARGRIIELEEDLGVAEGQDLEIQVRVIPSAKSPGDGLLRTEGALADDAEWDTIMAEIHNARKLERNPPAANLEGDLMIASAAIVHDLTLVTHNTSDYQNIPKLRLADWLR